MRPSAFIKLSSIKNKKRLRMRGTRPAGEHTSNSMLLFQKLHISQLTKIIMSLLKQRYEEVVSLNPERSTINCFVVAVAGRGYGRMEIRQAFKELVDPREYSPADTKGLYFPLIDSVSPKNRQVKFAGIKTPKKAGEVANEMATAKKSKKKRSSGKGR